MISVEVSGLELEEAGAAIEDVVLGVAGDVLFRVAVGSAQKTRVLTGRARGGWQTAIRTPKLSDNGRLDPSGSGVIAEATAVVRAMRLGDDGFATNVVPYILILNDGGVNRAPDKMVERTIDEVIAAYSGA